MNALDRAIAWCSPRLAYERAAYRHALDLSVRAYDAAKPGRRGDGFSRGAGSANSEIGFAASTIRIRARDLARNNPYAATIVSKLTASIWGAGIAPRLETNDIDDPRRIEARDLWNAFTDNSDPSGQLDFYGQMALGIRALNESGEFLIRRFDRPSSFGLKVPIQIDILEGDYIDSAKNEPLANGGAIIQGVEFDGFGRRVAYWLFDEHPGDTLTAFTRRSFTSSRVDASGIRHVYDPLRPGQARGISIFTPVVLKFKDIDDFEDATLMAAKIAACFAAFVTPPAGIAASPIVGASRTDDTAPEDRVERLGPAMIKYLKPGEEVTAATPPAFTGGIDFIKTQLRAAAVGSGVTYEMATGDLSGVNFSSIRIGRNDFLDLIDQKQWLCVIPMACNPVWNWVGQAAIGTGKNRSADRWAATWAPPSRRLMSPKEDIEAARESVRAGRTSLFDMIAETGEHPEEKLAEIARANKMLDDLDIVVDSDPRKVGRTSAAAPAATAAAA